MQNNSERDEHLLTLEQLQALRDRATLSSTNELLDHIDALNNVLKAVEKEVQSKYLLDLVRRALYGD